MINVNEAIKAAQDRNRKCWLEHAGGKLSTMIMNAASEGLRGLELDYVTLISGAEDLEEAAEMLYYVEKTLKSAGFNHKITENGNLYITW